jgi:hypothetical protein
MTPEDFHALRDGHSELKQQVGTVTVDVAAVKVDVAAVKEDLAANTLATAETRESMKRVEANTAELMEWLKAFQGAMKLLNMVGSVAKPLGYVAAFVSAALSAWYVFIHKGP